MAANKYYDAYYKSTTLISGSSSGIISSSLGGSVTGVLNLNPKAKYHILGEDIEVSGYVDTVAVATLNVLGKPFYDELKKNGVCFCSEIEEYLKVKFKNMERDNKIESILDKPHENI